MADVQSDIKDWSTTASSNSPTDSTTIGAGLADNLQQIQATVATAFRSKGSDIASATTTDLGGTVGLYHDITGTTTITSFGTTAATGQWKLLQFDGALTITYNATSMILPGNADISTATGDMAMVIHEGSGNWRMLWYTDDSESVKKLGYGQFTAKGDIIGSSATSTPSVISVGSDYALLWAEASATPGVKYGEITDLTEDTSPDITADEIITYDNDAAGHKKVLLGRVGGSVLATEQATTSGTSIDFTSIPAWVKKIRVLFNGVSTSGTSDVIIRLGDSGGLEATGYNSLAQSSGSTNTSTAGFLVSFATAAGNTLYGVVHICLEDSSDNTWVQSGITQTGSSASLSAGAKALSATLDRLSITTGGGSDTFDAGAINIMYEA